MNKLKIGDTFLYDVFSSGAFIVLGVIHKGPFSPQMRCKNTEGDIYELYYSSSMILLELTSLQKAILFKIYE